MKIYACLKILEGVAFIVAISVCVAACGTTTNDLSQSKVVYGNDDRMEPFDSNIPESIRRIAGSTVALVERSKLASLDSSTFKLPSETFGASMNLCSTEPFRSEPNPAFCSGFLIAPDRMATAGHCIDSDTACANAAFVFGFAYQSLMSDPTKISRDEVFYCKEVLHTQHPSDDADFAVVRLDRPVTKHPPLSVQTSATIAVGTSLTLIGHPAGLPLKIAPNAKVRSSDKPGFFVATTDSYGGNSGSAVIQSDTGLVAGILVRGEQDFVQQGSCNVSKICSETECRGEDVTRATQLAPYVNASSPTPTPTPPPSGDEISRTYDFDNLRLTIPDSNTSGISKTLPIDQAGTIKTASIHVKITHTYIGDLVVTLTHPDKTVVTLINRSGGSMHNIDRTFAVDQFQGKAASGNWILTVKDLARVDIGTLDVVNVTVKSSTKK